MLSSLAGGAQGFSGSYGVLSWRKAISEPGPPPFPAASRLRSQRAGLGRPRATQHLPALNCRILSHIPTATQEPSPRLPGTSLLTRRQRCGVPGTAKLHSLHRRSDVIRCQAQGTDAPAEAASSLRALLRRATRELASLPLAVGVLFAIAGACALGTVIEQGAAPTTYMENYPLESPVLGFLTWQVILGLGLDRVYTNPAFLALLLLLAACLSACTSTRQLPMLKVARRWKYMQKPSSVLGLQFSESLPSARLEDVAVELRRKGYEVFREGGGLYGFKGLAGRMAPIGVHAAMLLIMAGATFSSIGGFHGSVMLPQGLQVLVPDALVGNSEAARPSSSMNLVLQLDQFSIDYRPNGEVKQFYSDLRVLDFTGREVLHKTISVNDPLRCQGITVYQTDWAISSVQLRVDGQEPLKLPVATLPDPNGGDAKLFGTFLPLLGFEESEKPRGITILARDLQSVVLYDAEGKFVGVRRPGSRKPITVEGVSVVVDDVIGSSGMELKMDPGVPIVYAGFGSLILTSFISYLSHSQVWALQDGTTVHLGGRTNRAKYTFQEELEDIASAIPEVVAASADEVNEKGVSSAERDIASA